MQALSAKPVRMVGAEMTNRDDGGGVLKVPLKPGRFAGRIFRLPEGTTKSFEFDAIGKMVWEQCDGKTSVQQIIRKLAKFCKISPAEAKASTVKFLQMLGKKGLIGFTTKEKSEKSQ